MGISNSLSEVIWYCQPWIEKPKGCLIGGGTIQVSDDQYLVTTLILVHHGLSGVDMNPTRLKKNLTATSYGPLGKKTNSTPLLL